MTAAAFKTGKSWATQSESRCGSAEVSTSFSIGAEYRVTKEVWVGASFWQVNDGLDAVLDNTTAFGLNRGFR